MSELAAELESFRLQYPFDDAAYNYIVNSSLEVQKEVLHDFRPKNEGEQDYSALIISFTKKRRQFALERRHRFVPRADVVVPQLHPHVDIPVSREELEAFRVRYPCDEDAFRYVASSPPEVQRQIIQTFKPPREGEEDYSALVITFAKRCRNSSQTHIQTHIQTQAVPFRGPRAPPAGSGGGVNYEEFRARYPFDDATHYYLQRASAEVRIQVLRSFKPPREGEPDYSALLISFAKKVKDQSQHSRMTPHIPTPGPNPVPQWPVQPPRVQHTQPIPVYAHELPRPPRPTLGGNANNYALDGFRQKYPMDDRAFDFLKNAPPNVQAEVLERFSPQRQDTDYSALIISFAKKCREVPRPPTRQQASE